MQITTFDSDKNPQGKRHTLTWENFRHWLSTPLPRERPKNSLPMWSPATFRGDYRAAKNVELVYAMTYDVDEGDVPSLEQIATALPGLTYFVHSSSSATTAVPRWRLVVGLSRPVTAAEHGHMWRIIVERLPFKVGAASKDPSRAWYWPREGAE